MATQITLINNVLRRLREDEVETTDSGAYSQLIAMWINDGMRELSDRYAWSSLKHEITVTLAQGTSEYDISATVADGGDVPNTERPTTGESMLIWDRNGNRPSAYLFADASDATMNGQMRLMTEEDRVRRLQQDRDLQNLEPVDFSLKLAADGDGYLFTVWPTPAAARTVRISFWTPQAELSIDGTDDSTEIIVPNAAVEGYAHLTASNERGEEMGEPGNVLERRYINLLGGVMEAAMKNEERVNVYESYRD
jgi:hypothetical protein